VRISAATHPPVATQVATQAATKATAQPQGSPAIQPAATPQTVPAALLLRANGDGDGRTGSAALHDGDAAAHAAAQQVKTAGRSVDVKL